MCLCPFLFFEAPRFERLRALQARLGLMRNGSMGDLTWGCMGLLLRVIQELHATCFSIAVQCRLWTIHIWIFLWTWSRAAGKVFPLVS